LRLIDADTPDETMLRALERAGMLESLRRRSSDPLAPRVGELSVGERQRVALARVICSSAPMVLLDEPDANLDRLGIAAVQSVLKEVARQKMVLIVAHTPELLELADHVVTLEAGSLLSDVMRRPAKDVRES
jgi:ATP-binding cassette, subfamily C, bacterial CydCD